MCAPALSCLIGVTFIKHLCGLELKNKCIFSIPQSCPGWPTIRSFSSEDHAGDSDQLTRGRTDFRPKVSGGWRGLAPHVLHTHIGALAHSHWCSWPISPVLAALNKPSSYTWMSHAAYGKVWPSKAFPHWGIWDLGTALFFPQCCAGCSWLACSTESLNTIT